MNQKLIVITMPVLVCIIISLPLLTGSSDQKETDSDAALLTAARAYLTPQIQENTEITILGFTKKEKRFLYWLCIGDEAHHSYTTIEFALTKSGRLHPIDSDKPIDRGGDVASIYWSGGYSFLVNSSKCRILELVTDQGTELIPVENIPFVYYIDSIPLSYRFSMKK